jgi:hypothetical protein
MQKLFGEGRSRTSSTFPPSSSHDEPREPHTLATLAAALVTCDHPPACQVAASVVFGGQPIRITWCAACGAMTSDERAGAWTGSALSQLFSRHHFEELREFIRGVLEVHVQVATAGSRLVDRGSAIDVALRNVSKSLSELTSIDLVREIDRVEQAIAHLSSASPTAP